MKPYLKQYDLPCYPDTVPARHRRCVVGLEATAHGSSYNIWMGGGVIGTTQPLVKGGVAAVLSLRLKIRFRLEQSVVAARLRLNWEEELLRRWTVDPAQFEVTPDLP